MPRVSNFSRSLRGSPIRKMLKIIADAKARGIDLIKFSAGQPSLPPDEEIINYVIEYLKTNPCETSSYTPTQGIRELREFIAIDLERYSGLKLDPEREITVTEGASEGMLLAMMALLDEGDEAIIFDPSYVSYPHVITIARGKPVSLPLSIENEFQPSIEKLAELITPKTKLIFFASPDNPTGRILDTEIAKAIVDLARDHDLWIVSDEAYKHLIYEGEHVWMAKLAPERTVVLNTFSKDPAMTGWRLGYVYGPEDAVAEIAKIKQYVTLCSNTLAQIAAIKYLQPEVKERVLRRTIEIYRARRDAMYNAVRKYLSEAGVYKSPGAMYLFVDLSSYLERLGFNDEVLAERLVAEKQVATIPGSGFGSCGKNHLRLTFVSEPEERIIEGIKRIAELLGA